MTNVPTSSVNTTMIIYVIQTYYTVTNYFWVALVISINHMPLEVLMSEVEMDWVTMQVMTI